MDTHTHTHTHTHTLSLPQQKGMLCTFPLIACFKRRLIVENYTLCIFFCAPPPSFFFSFLCVCTYAYMSRDQPFSMYFNVYFWLYVLACMQCKYRVPLLSMCLIKICACVRACACVCVCPSVLDCSEDFQWDQCLSTVPLLSWAHSLLTPKSCIKTVSVCVHVCM